MALTKSFYVDTHERVENVRCRVDAGENGTKYIKQDAVEVMLSRGRAYKDQASCERIEFHVDSIIDAAAEPLHRFVEEAMHNNGGIGAYQSYFRKDKARKSSKSGHFKLTPKDDGSGIMVSGLQSREFGFGFPLFASIKDRVNKYRRGKKYKDFDAAAKVMKQEEKAKLVETDTFVCLFEYGNVEGKEGSWSYDNMILQLEDCIDVLTVAFGTTYDYVFLFDHSYGHDRMRSDAINVHRMNVSYAGKQIQSHSSKVQDHDGYFGNFSYPSVDDVQKYRPQLEVGKEATFIFGDEGIGPFWLTPSERDKQKFDKNMSKSTQKDKNKSDLQAELRAMGEINICRNKKQLHAMARGKGIELKRRWQK
eukprot:scaffold31668_cov55-Attheya_sp.AAC.5